MNRNSLLTSKDEAVSAVKTAFAILPRKLITDALNVGILAIAVTALAFSPILTKLSEIELSPVATIFNRLWIATVVISFWQLIKMAGSSSVEQAKSSNNDRQQGLLFLASFCATSSAILWAISLTQTSVASSTVLRSCTPLFISLQAWLILKQCFSYQFIVGMLLSIAGGMAIGWDDLQLSRDYLIGDSIALLSAALHGVNIVIIGYLRDRGCPTEKVLLWRCAGGALMVLPVVYLTDLQMFPSSLQGWLTIIALAVVCQTFGQGLLVHSLRQFSASFVGVFALLKPAITALLAWIIFAEDISLTSGIALVLILIGIYLARSNDSPTSERSW